MASNSDGSGSNGEFLLLLPAPLADCVECLFSDIAVTENFSVRSGSPRDYDTLKQQYEKANNEVNILRRHCEHARNVSYSQICCFEHQLTTISIRSIGSEQVLFICLTTNFTIIEPLLFFMFNLV